MPIGAAILNTLGFNSGIVNRESRNIFPVIPLRGILFLFILSGIKKSSFISYSILGSLPIILEALY